MLIVHPQRKGPPKKGNRRLSDQQTAGLPTQVNHLAASASTQAASWPLVKRQKDPLKVITATISPSLTLFNAAMILSNPVQLEEPRTSGCLTSMTRPQ